MPGQRVARRRFGRRSGFGCASRYAQHRFGRRGSTERTERSWMCPRMVKGVAPVRLRNRSVSRRVPCARGWPALWSVVSYLQLGLGRRIRDGSTSWFLPIRG